MQLPTELRYLESHSALKRHIKACSGREPNAGQVAFASSCLLHGRLFWDSAQAASLETKPLLLYYSAASFAKALIVCARGIQVGELAQGHGLSAASGADGTVGAYEVFRRGGAGLFGQFNDTVSPLTRVTFLSQTQRVVRIIPSATVDSFPTLRLSLVDILSRVFAVNEQFVRCTGGGAKNLLLRLNGPHVNYGHFEVRVDRPGSYSTREELSVVLQQIRQTVPFLQGWRVTEAWSTYGHVSITFAAVRLPDDVDELTSMTGHMTPYGMNLHVDANAFARTDLQFDGPGTFPPLAGGFGDLAVHVEPLQGGYLNEFSLTLAGFLLLSSLVRYEPHVWTSCVHRRPMAGRPVDDSLLPVVEAFLNTQATLIPSLVAKVVLAE